MISAVFGTLVLVWLVVIAAAMVATVFWIVELVDICRRRFENDTMKIFWLLVVCLTHFLGALVYYFVGKQMGTLPD